MKKISGSQILVQNADLRATRLAVSDLGINKIITETKEKQAEVLKLKDVDQKTLRMVVQL